MNELELVALVDRIEADGVAACFLQTATDREIELANLELERRGVRGRVYQAETTITWRST